ncbi:MAG TPA: hypothetical protein VER76_13035 [Pyrinomonadaceae bacterium]|nr:hypothetical protein [Pyrinomonadaceae bacterium]
MNCQKCKIEIEERNLRRERLSGAAEAHAETCAVCRTFREERLALSGLIGGLERVSAPADFDFRVRARMAAELSARRAPRPRLFIFTPAALSWPLAACLALVVSAALYFQPPPPDAVTQTPQASTASPLPPTAATSTAATSTAAETTSINEHVTGQQPELSDTRQGDGGATPLKNQVVRRQRRTLPERTGGGEVRGTRLETAQAQIGESTTASLLGSTVRFDATAAAAARRGEGALIPVQLGAQERPLKVLLRDRSGEARTISVDSVSFGSRDVIERPATFAKASLPSNQGVW